MRSPKWLRQLLVALADLWLKLRGWPGWKRLAARIYLRRKL